MTDWLGKPYYSLDAYLKKTFGEKVYKLSLDGGMTCPNRDGTCGDRGCIFCSAGGSGDFAGDRNKSIPEQIREQKSLLQQNFRQAAHADAADSYKMNCLRLIKINLIRLNNQ